MAKNTAEFSKGDNVVSKAWGKGVVQSVEHVEKPSDGDHTVYVVLMEDGVSRNLKAADLKGGKED